ncbi:MAG: protein kinase [Anaerolineae bacterium]|nr:protein kinase [Anaerolineae bacterium]
MQQTIPALIGNQFTVQEVLGTGGMGTVYRGMDMKTGDNVAIKLLKTEAIADDPDLVERFAREAEALRQLNHPNIVKVLATLEEEGRHYIIMEYVSGGSLSDLLKAQSTMPIRWVLKLAIELADALTRAHYLKIIHRDIKPANVLIAADGTPRLTDFGVAHLGAQERVTRTGSIVGTLDYLSPEALSGGAVDNRSDIWAFGVMLFEMLSGQRPFIGTSLTHLITQILTTAYPDLEQMRPDTPIGLIDLVYRMLEKDREARIPSIRLIGAELEAIMHGDTSTTTAAYAVRRSQEVRADSGQTPRFDTATPISDIPRHNLPAQTTPFVGRESELKELERLLKNRQNRLVTILGSGGMGKTRLSLQIAEQMLPDYAQGVYFVALAPLTAVENIVPAIAEAVRYTFNADGRDPKDQLLDYLREKHLLLVMDNFEHLIAGSPLVADILRAAPDVKVLTTSRERLNLSGETLFNLEGMDFPEWETPADALEYSAVKLFLQSARRARPDFELDAESLHYVARICRLVFGMPLGIVLAAAWVEMLPLAEIAEEIAKSLDFLETEMRDVPDRHRSIRAVFDYSWNLMTESERDSFMKLSVFHGGFTRQGAQEVTGTSLRSLTSLVNKSLLRRDPDTGRYTMHVLLHQYAAEKFDTCCGEGADIVNRHMTFYARMLHEVEPTFNGNRENAIVEMIDDDLENIRAAWRYALENSHWAELDQIQRSIMYYYLARSMLLEGANSFRELAEVLEKAGQAHTDVYWRARSNQAWLAGRQGDYETVVELSDQAYHYFEGTNNGEEICVALNNLSYARMMQGEYETAEDYARNAFKLAEERHYAYPRYMSLANLGYAMYLHGNYDDARQIYEQLNNDPDAKDYSSSGRAYGLNNLGEIMQATGEFETANRLYAEAYTMFKATNHRRGMAFTSNNLAGVSTVQGKYEEAQAIYEEAYKLNREIGDRNGIGHSLSALGNVEFYRRNIDGAEYKYRESLAIRRQMGDRRGIADSLHDLGDAALAKHQFIEAEKLYTESLEIRRQISDPTGIVHAMSWLAIAKSMGSEAAQTEAYTLFNEALALSEQISNPYSQATVLIGIGELEFHRGNYAEAQGYFTRVLGAAIDYQVHSVILYLIAAFAALLAAEDEKVRALEMIALVHQQPRTEVTFMTDDRVRSLLQTLQQDLPTEVAEAAILRGQASEVMAVAKALLPV